MELMTMHTHTGFTGHGQGTVEELACAAEAAGIASLAVTEHFPLSKAFDQDAYLSMDEASIPLYVEAVEQARRAHPGLEIVLGTEFDWLGDFEDRPLAEGSFSPFSLVLGSVHFVDAWPFDDPAQRGRWEEPGAADAIWKRYFELWCDAATSSLPFTVMSHPDLAKKFGYCPTYDLAPLYAQAAEAAASAGRMVEVNTSGLYYACKEMFPAPALLAEFCRAGVPCTVGTDAHVPANVARNISDAYRLMHEAGYRAVTAITASGDRRAISLG